ncbi:DEAD/DEAH box helicase, partial [Candidatus Bathyarchaeota archaeon]|nr:DEAD/DEAH box helicase [Candidatus Bathyarchaeota archaeon]
MPVQIEVIPKILNGNNLVICSPTASGKTEAVMAPICEKIQLCRSRGLKVLYITPTKALANDLRGRLTQPLADMCVTIDIKTGDRPFDCRKSVDILVTTPESFDSLLCRHPEIFSSLRFVVLDELHLLDGTYRGDQLRLLLKRLDQIAGKMQTIILSATLADPKEVAKRYVDDFEISIVKDQKEIEYE